MYNLDRTRPHTSTSSRRHRPSSRSVTRSRSRSRSPHSHHREDDRKRSRSHRHRDRDRVEEDSRDKRRKSHHHRDHRDHHHCSSRKHEEHHDRCSKDPEPAAPVPLPFGSRQLSKRDLAHYEPVLGMYLDIQKNLILEDLSEVEVKGRWKSFMGKWNRGELAEGWYDPSTLQKARSSFGDASSTRDRTRSLSRTNEPEPEPRPRDDTRDSEMRGVSTQPDEIDGDEDDEDDEFYGPTLPQQEQQVSTTSEPQRKPHNQKSGPTIPKTDDLQIQRELNQSSHQSEKSHSRRLHQQAVASHKSELKHIQEEIAPRADPGTHERRMEKRQERAAANRSFAQSARGGSPVDGLGDDELMGGGGGGGGGGDSLEAMKKEREKEARKKNERELRREEMLRARVAEREERMEAYRRKEDETMSALKALAKQRFG